MLVSALIFLTRYNAEHEDYLNKIVTDYETWVAYVTPESKHQSIDQENQV